MAADVTDDAASASAGTLNPAALRIEDAAGPNGDYVPSGTYNSQPCYSRRDGSYHIAWSTANSRWQLNYGTLGNDYTYWYRSGTIDGTYTPGHHTTGNPVVFPASISRTAASGSIPGRPLSSQ